MNGYGSHTFKLVNKDGNPVYCKFHYKVGPHIIATDCADLHVHVHVVTPRRVCASGVKQLVLSVVVVVVVVIK